MKSNRETTISTVLARISGTFLMFLAVSACEPCVEGEGKVLQKTMEVDSFAVVVIKGPADLFLSQNRFPWTVTVKAQENLIDLIDISVVNGKLEVEVDHCYNSDEAVEVYANTNVVEGLTVKGSGDIHTMTELRGSSLDVEIDGSGDLTAETNYRRMSVQINGSGDARLDGHVGRMEISINGSGDVKAPNMTCESTSVSINGSGDAFVNSEKFLEANINGSGDIRYTGFPTDTTFSIRGSGTIKSAY